MNFLNNTHEIKYLKLIQEASIHELDTERKALFYIISGDEDLFRKRNYIYDFYDSCIKPDCLNSYEIDFCSSSKSLIRLGFNLYNGYTDDFTTPLWILSGLDSKNFAIAAYAIQMRFGGVANFMSLVY